MLKSLLLKSLNKDASLASVRILVVALVVAVGAVTSIGFFTDRVNSAMLQQATQLLGADLLISSSQPIPEEIVYKAQTENFRLASTVTFPSVVLTDDDDSKLVIVKAVSKGYPLYGKLFTYPLSGEEADQSEANIPARSALYVDPSLKGALDLKPDSELALGHELFGVSAQIAQEPDRSGSLFQLAPRVMINLQDLDATQLLVEGSRVRYALLIAGSETDILPFKEWVLSLENASLEFLDATDASPQVKRVLTQINRFFGLTAMVAVLLSGAAIAISARQYALRQALSGAVLRAMGLSRQTVILWILVRVLIMAVVALILGLALGYFAQGFLSSVLGTWFSVELPDVSWRPVLTGAIVTILCLLGFAGLPVVQSGTVPVVNVLREQLGGLSTSTWLLALLALVSVALMMYLQSQQASLVLILLSSLIVMFVVFALSGQLIYRLMQVLVPRKWSIVRFILRRRTRVAVLQLSIFGFIVMTMLAIWIIRQDVLYEWQKNLPENAADRFLVNVQSAQLDGVLDFLKENYSFDGQLYPVSRGRLVAVNDEPAEKRYIGNDRAQGYLRHEFNLSFADEQPEHNTLSEGQWWSANTDAFELSLEQRFASRMGLELGDRMSFLVAGSEVTATVSNIREVAWESFNVNFFAITSRAALDKLPHTFITSFRQGEVSDAVTARLIREFPGITVIEVDKIIAKVRSIIDRASVAVQAVFGFTLVAGFIVLFAAVQGNQLERMREIAILRTMGASHRQLNQSVIFEFALIGAVAGLLASIFAASTAYLVSTQVMNFTLSINPLLWIYGTVGGSIVVGIAGYIACRGVLNRTPLSVLQAS